MDPIGGEAECVSAAVCAAVRVLCVCARVCVCVLVLVCAMGMGVCARWHAGVCVCWGDFITGGQFLSMTGRHPSLPLFF